MTERDSDIEFDFFDEPETQETTQRRRLRTTRPGDGRAPGGPKPPRRPRQPAPGLLPLLRLVGFVVGAIVVVVLLVFLVQSCRGESKQNAYRDYMGEVQRIARGSVGVGRDLNDVLTTRGKRQGEIVSDLTGLAQQQSQFAAQARELDPPGPLRVEQQNLVEVLQLRASGLSRLADAFRQTAESRDASAAGELLAEQARLLVASDVNWDFYFKEPAVRELKRQGITGVAVPDSDFVQNSELASARSMVPIFRRINGAATGGAPTGVHGNTLVQTRVLPSGEVLSETEENAPIRASTDLAFEVTVENTGENQEVEIPVTLTIQTQTRPITKREVIDLIDVGETRTVVFSDIGQPDFGQPTTIKVAVTPVRGEKNPGNNSAEYSVVFSLG